MNAPFVKLGNAWSNQPQFYKGANNTLWWPQYKILQILGIFGLPNLENDSIQYSHNKLTKIWTTNKKLFWQTEVTTTYNHLRNEISSNRDNMDSYFLKKLLNTTERREVFKWNWKCFQWDLRRVKEHASVQNSYCFKS